MKKFILVPMFILLVGILMISKPVNANPVIEVATATGLKIINEVIGKVLNSSRGSNIKALKIRLPT